LFYKDYFIVPIVDSENNVNTFEARKLKAHETICKYFNMDVSTDSGTVKKRLETFIEDGDLKYKKGKVFSGDDEIDDATLRYLMSPKVLYPKHSGIGKTIFNADNLDYKSPLYLVEGIGSVARIYNEVSENVSCVFGASMSDDQVKILSRFEKVIHIPDPDFAGYQSVGILKKKLNDRCYFVKDVVTEDTDSSYVKDIMESVEVKSDDYLKQQYLKHKY
jgi:DNA primase